jgi:DNA-binding MarR family transcriptional regulator
MISDVNAGRRYTIPEMTDPRQKAGRRPAALPDELLESDAFLLKRLGFQAKEQAMEAFSRAGLSPYHHAVLAVLDEGARDTQGSIADALGYDHGQLVGLLDELERQGLVERRRDPRDRRRHLVSMTADGRRTLERLRALVHELEDEFFAPLDAAQRAALHDLLLELARRHEPRCAGLPAAS